MAQHLYISQSANARLVVYNQALLNETTVLEQIAAETIQTFTNNQDPMSSGASSNSISVNMTGISATVYLQWQAQLIAQRYTVVYASPNLNISV